MNNFTVCTLLVESEKPEWPAATQYHNGTVKTCLAAPQNALENFQTEKNFARFGHDSDL